MRLARVLQCHIGPLRLGDILGRMDPDGRRLSMSVTRFLCTALVAAGLVRPCVAAVAESDMATPPGGHPSGNFVLLGHCSKCHNSEDWAGGIAFDTISTTD